MFIPGVLNAIFATLHLKKGHCLKFHRSTLLYPLHFLIASKAQEFCMFATNHLIMELFLITVKMKEQKNLKNQAQLLCPLQLNFMESHTC